MNELVFIVTPLMIGGIFAFLYASADKENPFLKILFLISAMIFLVIGANTNVTLALLGNSSATYTDVYNIAKPNAWATMFVFITTIAILFVMILYTTFQKSMKGKWNRELHDYNQ
jgi:hypothetical protein